MWLSQPTSGTSWVFWITTQTTVGPEETQLGQNDLSEKWHLLREVGEALLLLYVSETCQTKKAHTLRQHQDIVASFPHREPGQCADALTALGTL